MSIKLIQNYNFSQKNISFSKKRSNKETSNLQNQKSGGAVPAHKLVPAMMALAGLTTLNGCSEDFTYTDMRNFKNECFDAIQGSEKKLSEIEEKTFVLNTEKDSLYKETSDYKYRHLRIKSSDHTRVFGEIIRKKDDKALEFINVYDEEDKLTSSTLKDPKTNETFYVTYENGFFNKVTDKDGNELPSSKYGDYLLILVMALGLYGVGRVVKESFAKGMTNKDVPFIEPPQHKED